MMKIKWTSLILALVFFLTLSLVQGEVLLAADKSLKSPPTAKVLVHERVLKIEEVETGYIMTNIGRMKVDNKTRILSPGGARIVYSSLKPKIFAHVTFETGGDQGVTVKIIRVQKMMPY